MTKRKTYRWALKELGLPVDYDLRSDASYEASMRVWKELTVAARRNGDDDRAATLSLCKSLIQKRHHYQKSKYCPTCGSAKGPRSANCHMCNRALKNSNKLDEYTPMEMHKIEAPMPIPPVAKRIGALTETLKILATGHIGDSFVTNRNISSVAMMAKLLGGQVICRSANPTEKDPKKKLYRVWRSDGMTMEEVNEVIKNRQASQEVPKPVAWMPLPPQEMKKFQQSKHPKRQKGKP